MGEVLTKEEDAALADPDIRIVALAAGRIIDRLVAEVERLRARNEKLEAVAKAAKEFRNAFFVYIDEDDVELPSSGPLLDDALAALEKP